MGFLSQPFIAESHPIPNVRLRSSLSGLKRDALIL